jgi:lipopolysaccharide export system permease protein
MSADNEMIALRACGVSLLRVCLPVVFVGALLSLFTFWINASVAPRAEQAMRESIASMARSNPVALFVADEVVSQFRGKKIFVGGKKGDVLADLTIIEQTDGSSITRVIYAREGRIEAEEKKGALLLKLSDAKFEQRQEGEENNFDKIQHGISIGEVSVDIPFEDLVDQGLRSRPLRSYTVPELRAYFSTVKSLSERTAVLTELSKRFSLSLACIAFALAAMPLGITAQRKETSVGFGISLGLAFSYFLFVVLAEMLRNDAQFYPYLLLWIPNLLFVGIGGWLLLRLDYR